MLNAGKVKQTRLCRRSNAPSEQQQKIHCGVWPIRPGELTYRCDLVRPRGAPIPTHQIKRAISDTFLAKKGSLVDRSRKGVIGCETAQNLGNFNILFWRKFPRELHFFCVCSNFDHFVGKFWSKSKNKGSLRIKLWKRGHSVTNRCIKGICLQAHDVGLHRHTRRHSHWKAVQGSAPLKTALFRPFFSFRDHTYIVLKEKCISMLNFSPIVVKFQLMRLWNLIENSFQKP